MVGTINGLSYKRVNLLVSLNLGQRLNHFASVGIHRWLAHNFSR